MGYIEFLNSDQAPRSLIALENAAADAGIACAEAHHAVREYRRCSTEQQQRGWTESDEWLSLKERERAAEAAAERAWGALFDARDAAYAAYCAGGAQ